jgi:hypothetical protein
MYGLLRRFLPAPVAALALMLWYAALILAVAICLHAAPAPFRYLEI